MTHSITLIQGDGIGPEVTEAVLLVLARSGVDIEWDRHDAGVDVIEREGTPLPQTVRFDPPEPRCTQGPDRDPDRASKFDRRSLSTRTFDRSSTFRAYKHDTTTSI